MSFIEQLISSCHEYEIIIDSIAADNLNQDLLESGIIDSMGIALFQEMVSERYELEIPTELFIVELRTLQSISDHIVANSPVASKEFASV